jgi:hypothetical protein
MRRLDRPSLDSMPDDSDPPPPAESGELAPDRCPNCGGMLKFSENRPEGLCSSCGIFVEVLRSSPSKPKAPIRPLPSKIKIRTATTRELLVLCHKYGLSRSGKKEDLVDRLLMYVDEQGWQAKVAAAPKKLESAPTEDNASRKQWATFLMNFESELPDEDLEAKEDKPVPEEPATPGTPEPTPEAPAEPEAPSPEPAAEEEPEASPEGMAEPEPRAESSEPVTEEPPVPEPETPAAPEDTVSEIVPSPSEEETMPEPVPEVEPEPTVPEEEAVATAYEAEPVAVEAVAPFVTAPRARAAAAAEEQATPTPSRVPPVKRSRWRRAAYYLGVVYVSIGGAGLILGSILHDLFRVPIVGESYTTFGRLNVDAVILGLIFLGVGLAAIAVGVRRIAARPVSAAGA